MEPQPGRFEFFPHTADAKFKAYGTTMEECFSNAAIATFEIITETAKVKPVKEFPIEARSKRLQALLFDFLDELLFLLDTEGFLLHETRALTIRQEKGDYVLNCVAVGDYHKKYDVSCNVKAVTYNDMELKTPKETGKPDGQDGAWECQVVVDL